MHHAFTSAKMLKEGEVRDPCAGSLTMNAVCARPPRGPHPRTASLHPADDFVSSSFNNSQRSSRISPDCTPADHRVLWSRDPHAQPRTAHLLNLLRYRVPW